MENGKDKIKRICEAVRKDTLDPALEESRQILQKAQEEAEKIIQKAESERHDMLHAARSLIEKEKAVCRATLLQAGKQAVETLKQEIEKLFQRELGSEVQHTLNKPELIASIINILVEKLQEDGIEADFEAVISHQVSASEVSRFLLKKVIDKLQDQPLKEMAIGGGVLLKLKKEHISFDASEEVITKMLANFIRKDLRDLLFQR